MYDRDPARSWRKKMQMQAEARRRAEMRARARTPGHPIEPERQRPVIRNGWRTPAEGLNQGGREWLTGKRRRA